MVPVLVKRRTDYYELGEFSCLSPISRKAFHEIEPGLAYKEISLITIKISFCKITTFLSYHQKFFEFFFVIIMKFTISAVRPTVQDT